MLFYLVIPLIAISIILTSYPELSKERFIKAIYWIVPVSIIIIAISQLSTKYKQGETKKFILNISYVAATLVWIYGFLGGSIILQQKWMEYEFQIHLWKYMILIILAAAINTLYYILEWRFYKEQQKTKTEKTQYANKIPAETA